MNDPSVKAYYLFLHWILPKITGLNEFFQSDKPTITMVHSKMVSAYQDFLLMFMQRDFVMRSPLQDVNPSDASRHLPLGQLYIGVDARAYLDRPDIAAQPHMVSGILDRCRKFMVTLCLKMKEK